MQKKIGRHVYIWDFYRVSVTLVLLDFNKSKGDYAG